MEFYEKLEKKTYVKRIVIFRIIPILIKNGKPSVLVKTLDFRQKSENLGSYLIWKKY